MCAWKRNGVPSKRSRRASGQQKRNGGRKRIKASALPYRVKWRPSSILPATPTSTSTGLSHNESPVYPLDDRLGDTQSRVGSPAPAWLLATDSQHARLIAEDAGNGACTQLPQRRQFFWGVMPLNCSRGRCHLRYSQMLVAQLHGQSLAVIPLTHLGGASLKLFGPHH
jgi:hypothetical protein